MKKVKVYKYLSVLMFVASAVVMVFAFNKSSALPDDWYSDYTYTLDEDNKTITLSKYNGTDTEVTVPASATINNKKYDVVVVGTSSSNALFAQNNRITKVTFKNGVKGGTKLNYLFYSCDNLKEVYFNNFDTSETTSMNSMFQSCGSLHTIEMASFTSESLKSIHYMFASTSSLTKIYLGHFNFLYTDPDNAKNAYSFGRGTWRRLEDGKDYSGAQIVYNSGTKDISGTYVFQNNITKEMYINYNVKYRIGKLTKIDEYSFTNNDLFTVKDNALYIKNITVTSSADYLAPGSATLLMKNVVSDANNNTYNLRITVDNIHLYDLNTRDEGVTSYSHYIMGLNDNTLNIGSYNYDASSKKVNNDRSSKYDITLEVVNDAGVAQEGSFVFSAYDLDIPANTTRGREAIYQYSSAEGWGNYSEGINLLEGYDNSTLKMFPVTTLIRTGNRIYGTRYDEKTELSEFSVKANSNKFKFTWTGEDCGTIVLEYYQPIFVDIIKQDNNGNNLAGAVFELYSGSELIDTWTSTKQAHKAFLNPGYYTVKEKTAPNNYIAGSNISFYVDTTGNIIVNTKKVENIVVKNTGKPVRVIVRHIDENTNVELARTVDENKKYGDTYTSSSKNFDNYVLTRKPVSETVTLIEDETVLTYYYAKVSAGVLEKHIDINTNRVLYNETHTGKVGDDYNILSKTFDGYDLVTTRLPSNSTGKMKEELTEVVYYYNQRARITIKYIDKDTDEPLEADTIIDGHVNDNYSSTIKDFSGYIFVESTGKTSGKLEATNDDVIYYYQRVVYVTTEVNGEGGTIVGDETVKYGGDSTKDNIIAVADKDYFISKITINGKEIEITNSNKMVLDSFMNMEENKHVVVEFTKLTLDVPMTDFQTMLPFIGLILLGLGVLFVYLGNKKTLKRLEI